MIRNTSPDRALLQAAKLTFSTLSNVAPMITSANVTDLLQTPQGVNQGTLHVAANASALVMYLILTAGSPQPTSAQVSTEGNWDNLAVSACWCDGYADSMQLLSWTWFWF